MKIVDKLKTDTECFHLQQPVLTNLPNAVGAPAVASPEMRTRG
jgi:hypothetical protein